MKNLVNLRKNRNLTQKQLADAINVKQNTISQYELDKREPSIDMLKKLAKILTCTVDDLIA